ncbi:MAG: DUF917 domain-containing protein [Hyphomicrobiales bacterium]|nr:DUF917 domain-containing protein [Hyphomicrobiales bacterium]
MELTLDKLHDFARGAAFLGTGGGGDPYVGRLILQQQLAGGKRVTLIDPADLGDEDLVVPVANMGAPTVLIERFPNGPAAVAAVRKIEELLGRKAAAIMPIEAGGVNATLPAVVGALMDLPVVDADGMGRAFPELQMTTFSIYGVPGSPVVIKDEHGNEVVVQAVDDNTAEWLARVVCMRMGGKAEITLYPMSGHDAKTKSVPRTISLAMDIGRVISDARSAHDDPFTALTGFFGAADPARFCEVLFDGKVADLLRETTRGFAIGKLMLQHIDGSGEPMEIVFQNEFLSARIGDHMLATAPDLICILDRETAEPITTEGLRYGQRVKVIGVSVPPVMRTPEALAVWGPRVFGVDRDYVPIEEIRHPG